MDNHLSIPHEYPVYNIGVVTRLTGVPVATLRAWERRYGFPQAARTPGGHRLYSEKDVTHLQWVKAQIGLGLSTRHAIAAARKMEVEGHAPLAQVPAPQPLTGSPPQVSSVSRKQLVDALLQHDLERTDRLMGEMLAFHSPEELTLKIIGPALNGIGEAWEQGRITVATEHLASNYLRHRILMWLVTGPWPRPVNPVVLACAPDELHEGGLLMLGVLLRRQGWPVAYLGQSVPFADLADFVKQIAPPVIVFSTMGEDTARVLSEWPKWIPQIDGSPIVAFGGRPFVKDQQLAESIPGVYLGPTIEEGFRRLTDLLQDSSPVVNRTNIF